MKGVKGAGFGVRFYRRSGAKLPVRNAATERNDAVSSALSGPANTAESIDELERVMSRAVETVRRIAMPLEPVPVTFTVPSAKSGDRGMTGYAVMTAIPSQTDTVLFVPDKDVPATQAPAQDKAAMRRRQAAEVKALLQQKTGPGTKELALWSAAKSGDCPRIRVLVLDGVDLDARDAQGRTAINIATQYNRHDALKTLLAAREMRRMAALGELPRTRFFAKFAKTGTEKV